MYLNQWTKQYTTPANCFRYFLYPEDIHKINVKYNTFLGIYEK